MRKISPDDIDAILPQTQCGLCGYKGCMPYAEAIAYEAAPIHLCPPGGVEILIKLGELLGESPAPFLAVMEKKAKPQKIASIREAECIGCTKCIQACPVDAIIGSAKHMHTVISDECTGCELCVAPCPVDCIDLIWNLKAEKNKNTHFRKRFNNRQQRLEKEAAEKKSLKKTISLMEKKNYIAEAIARAKAKKK